MTTDPTAESNETSSDPPGAPGFWKPGRRRVAIGFVLIAMTLLRFEATRAESINWDEFVLFHNVALSQSSGKLHGGGRPGLAVLILLPFTEGCDDEISVIRRARLLWMGITFAALFGLALLLRQLADASRRFGDCLLGLSLFACVPAFLIWSVQVRTDQIALAGGLWGGVALLASRRRPSLAVLAGILFAIGYLGTQKAIYIAALMGLLAIGDHWRLRDWNSSREGLRVVLCAGSLGIAVLGFYALVPLLFGQAGGEAARAVSQLGPQAAGSSVRFHLSVFDYYRQTIGFSQYREMLPLLGPHLLLGLAMVGATLHRLRDRAPIARRLGLAWAVLGLGVAVGLFHAGAFAYFWMTLGLFPAVAFVLARSSVEEWLARLRVPARRSLAIVFWAALLAPGGFQSFELLRDTQAVQRESLAFVHRNFEPEDAGFHTEAGLFCQAEPDRFPIYLSQFINEIFGPAARCLTCAPDFIRDIEAKQVKYVVSTYRLNQFPPLIREFWQKNYLPYLGAVLVAGKRFEATDHQRRFDLVVDGDYLWLPNSPPAEISIDGVRVPTGGRIHLERGSHLASVGEGASPGVLVLAMGEPPKLPLRGFYKQY